MFKKTVYYSALLTLIFLYLAGSSLAQSGTSFTYQGRMNDNNVQPTRTYLFEFKLFDAATGGNQVGATQSDVTANVVSGVFTVELDFGAVFTSGTNRYLEISVKRDAADSYTILSPRQRITSAVYAQRAQSAAMADDAISLGGVAANQYVQTSDPRLSGGGAPAPGSPNYIQNSSVLQSATNFNISGDGTLGGTLSANTVNAAAQFSIAGSRILGNTGTNNLFGGINAGTANTTGQNNAFFGTAAGTNNTTGAFNTFYGALAGSANTTSTLR